MAGAKALVDGLIAGGLSAAVTLVAGLIADVMGWQPMRQTGLFDGLVERVWRTGVAVWWSGWVERLGVVDRCSGRVER